jgi:hypothetical protein
MGSLVWPDRHHRWLRLGREFLRILKNRFALTKIKVSIEIFIFSGEIAFFKR